MRLRRDEVIMGSGVLTSSPCEPSSCVDGHCFAPKSLRLAESA